MSKIVFTQKPRIDIDAGFFVCLFIFDLSFDVELFEFGPGFFCNRPSAEWNSLLCSVRFGADAPNLTEPDSRFSMSLAEHLKTRLKKRE